MPIFRRRQLQHSLGHPLQLILPLLLALLSHAPVQVRAQIASPSNAGGNSGNNTSGSSTTPFSTPTFSPTQTVPSVPGITVDSDGTISASPAVVVAFNTAVSTAVATPEASLLAPVVVAAGSQVSATDLTNPNLPPDVILSSAAGQSQQTFLSLLQEVASEFAAGTLGSSFQVSSATTGSSGTVTLSAATISVSTAGSEVTFASTPETQLILSQYAAIGVAAGLTAQTIAIGAALVAVGVPPVQTTQLMLSLQGLANSSNLTALSNGIDTFNSIVSVSSESVIESLSGNPVFTAARATLIAARDALGG